MESIGTRKGKGRDSVLPPVQTSRAGKNNKMSSIALFSAQLSDKLGVGIPIIVHTDQQTEELQSKTSAQQLKHVSMCSIIERLDLRPFVHPGSGSATHDETPVGGSPSSTSIVFDDSMFATDNEKVNTFDLEACDPRAPEVLESIFGPIRFGYKTTLTLPTSPAVLRSSMDPIKNARLQQTFVSVIVLGNALRMFESVLRQINADKNIRAETQRFPPLRAGIVAARLALAHAKKLNQNVNGSSDAYDHIKYSDDPACRLSQKKRESSAKIALGRCQLLHDMLLYIPARKILLLARRVVATSTPLLRETTGVETKISSTEALVDNHMTAMQAKTKYITWDSTMLEASNNLFLIGKHGSDPQSGSVCMDTLMADTANENALFVLPNIRFSPVADKALQTLADAGRDCLVRAEAAYKNVITRSIELRFRIKAQAVVRERLRDQWLNPASMLLETTVLSVLRKANIESYIATVDKGEGEGEVDDCKAEVAEVCSMIQKQLTTKISQCASLLDEDLEVRSRKRYRKNVAEVREEVQNLVDCLLLSRQFVLDYVFAKRTFYQVRAEVPTRPLIQLEVEDESIYDDTPRPETPVATTAAVADTQQPSVNADLSAPKSEPKSEPKLEPKPEPKLEPKPEPKLEPKPEPEPEPKLEPASAPSTVAAVPSATAEASPPSAEASSSVSTPVPSLSIAPPASSTPTSPTPASSTPASPTPAPTPVSPTPAPLTTPPASPTPTPSPTPPASPTPTPSPTLPAAISTAPASPSPTRALASPAPIAVSPAVQRLKGMDRRPPPTPELSKSSAYHRALQACSGELKLCLRQVEDMNKQFPSGAEQLRAFGTLQTYGAQAREAAEKLPATLATVKVSKARRCIFLADQILKDHQYLRKYVLTDQAMIDFEERQNHRRPEVRHPPQLKVQVAQATQRFQRALRLCSVLGVPFTPQMIGMMPHMDPLAVISKYPHLQEMLQLPPPSPFVDRYDDAMRLQQIASRLGHKAKQRRWRSKLLLRRIARHKMVAQTHLYRKYLFNLPKAQRSATRADIWSPVPQVFAHGSDIPEDSIRRAVVGGEWLSGHLDELDDITPDHRLAGRKRPYHILITSDLMERGEGEDHKNVLLTPRGMRRERLGLRGFLDANSAGDERDDEEDDEWDGGGDGGGGVNHRGGRLGAGALSPLPQMQRMRLAAGKGVKTIFCKPEGETIEEEKKRWLSVRTRALSDYASGTAALELVDFDTVVTTSPVPIYLFYMALRPISFIIPLYMELNSIAKSIARCGRRLRARLLKLREDRERIKQAAVLLRKQNLSGLTERVAEWTPQLPHMLEPIKQTQKVAQSVWKDLMSDADGRVVVARDEVKEELLLTQQRIDHANELLADFRARVEQYHRMHEPDYFFPGDTRKMFRNLDQAETLFVAVTEAIEATTAGQSLIERVKKSTLALGREREQAALKKVTDAKNAADMAEAAFEKLRDSVARLDMQASQEIEEGQKIVDHWSARIDDGIAAWRKFMIEDMEWQEEYAEDQIEQLNLESPPDDLHELAQAIVDAYNAGKDCEKTFTALSAEWETKLAAVHEQEGLESEKVQEIKKEYDRIYKEYRSR